MTWTKLFVIWAVAMIVAFIGIQTTLNNSESATSTPTPNPTKSVSQVGSVQNIDEGA